MSSGMARELLAAALAKAGQKDKAQAAAKKAIQLEPAFSIGYIRSQHPGIHETTSNNLLESLRKAGVPE